MIWAANPIQLSLLIMQLLHKNSLLYKETAAKPVPMYTIHDYAVNMRWAKRYDFINVI